VTIDDFVRDLPPIVIDRRGLMILAIVARGDERTERRTIDGGTTDGTTSFDTHNNIDHHDTFK
jgi:hypothetical protein